MIHSGLSQDEVYDLLAKFCYAKDFADFQKRLSNSTTKGLYGMKSYRLLANGDTVYVGAGRPPAEIASANTGYRFVFKAGNDTRFS